jgi:tetratricopeptide (TPR) repeat protein
MKNNLYLRGLELARQERYDEAVRALKASLSSDFRDPEIHYGLGLVYLLSGDKNAAAQEYQIVMSLDPSLGQNFAKFISNVDQLTLKV